MTAVWVRGQTITDPVHVAAAKEREQFQRPRCQPA